MTHDAISTHRIKVFRVLLALNVPGALWFTVVNFFRELPLLASLELVIVLSSAVLLWRINQQTPYATYLRMATLFVALFAGFLLFAMNQSGISHNIYIWITTVPLMAYLLLGSSRGLLITSVFMSLVVVSHLLRFEFLAFWQSLATIGNVVSVVMIIWGLSHAYELANEKAQRQLQELASKDHLTGLMNRSLLNSTFRQASADTDFTAHVLGVIVMDIDHFKAINDAHGHETGDRVLMMYAESLKSFAGQPEYAFRLGGEEFCLIIPDSSAVQINQLAEQIRSCIAEQSLDQLGITRPVTISCGVAISEHPDTSFEDLHKLADQRMYQAKALGRNQVVSQA